MSKRMACPLGHFWDMPEESSGSVVLRIVCPTCGAPGRRMPDNEQTLVQDPSSERTVADPHAGNAGWNAAESSGEAAGQEDDPLRTMVERQSAPGMPPRSPSHSQISSRSLSSSAMGRAVLGAAGTNSAPGSAGYTIIRQHAAGGLGCVQLARDEAIQRDVALKQIQPHLTENSHSRSRFVAEAKVTGRLEHPGIVPVYTMGTDAGGNPYYVMKFVRGRTLDEVIMELHANPNPIVFRELLRRFVAICQAIAYAHSRGIIHRDIKPQNVMLGDYGETLVLDWGLAKDLKDKSAAPRPHDAAGAAAGAAAAANSIVAAQPLNTSLTMDGQVIGTPAYMSPEQSAGRTDLHAPPTDIYSLGAVLYKLLTGRAPNTGKSTNSSNLRKYEPPPAPHTLKPEVHPELERICLKAMAEHPEQRYQRAMELSEEIQRFLDDVPLRSGRAQGNTVMRWAKSNMIAAVAIGALALLVIVLTIVLATRGGHS